MPRPVFGTATLLTGIPEASRRGEGVIYRLFGTATLPIGTPEPSPRGEGVFWPVFGTATLPTGTSGASMRGETVWNRCQTGLLPETRPDFGTAPPPTGALVASTRSHCELAYRIVAEFHEDRWQRTAEDSERRVFPRTWEAGGTHRI